MRVKVAGNARGIGWKGIHGTNCFTIRKAGGGFHVFDILFLSLWTLSAAARMATDFNPMDFRSLKLCLYPRVDSIRLQLNPDLLNNRIRHSVAGD